jgi:hypothetical protein
MNFLKIFLNNYRRNFPSEIPSVNLLVIKKYYYRRVFSVSKSVGNNIFWLPTTYRWTKNYRWKIHQRSIFVGDFIRKLITDGICVLHWWKNSVGKTIKSCSGIIMRKTLRLMVLKIILKSQSIFLLHLVI